MRRKRYFSFPKRSDQLLGLPSMLFIGYRGALSPLGGWGVLKCAWLEADHLTSYSATVVNAGATHLYLYSSMYRHIVVIDEARLQLYSQGSLD